MQISINAEKCTGCMACMEACSEVFEAAGDKSAVKTPLVPRGCEATCRTVKNSCPAEAITITN
ncbi:MAG: ferredoxin [Candidatus Staskawiczbacteria bacterium]|nr:ferredoxin [Candidatus Staskawiczbacteria bacterium]